MTGRGPRVLHVLEALEGGASRHVVDLVGHARGSRHEVVIPPRRIGGLTDVGAATAMREAGAAVHRVDMRRTPWAPANARAVRALRRLAAERQPHVVHAHSSIGGFLARLATVGSGVPIVYTPHGITDVRAGLLVERALRRRTARMVAVSATEGEAALRQGLAVEGQLRVIPNGITLQEPAPIDLRGRLGIAPSVPLVGTIARLVPQKAPEHFVQACALVAAREPSARFVLIGGGQMEAEVEALVDSLGLRSRFDRIDQLPGAAGALHQLDVFVLSSRFEGGPYAPLEAMRAGVATVLTDVVGNRDVVEHDRSGLLVAPLDPAALAQGILALLGDPARRDRLARAGRSRVAERFDVEIMGAALDELYRELAADQRLHA